MHSGSAFHRGGPARETERRHVLEVVTGNRYNALSADRKARHVTYGVISEAMYVGVRCVERETQRRVACIQDQWSCCNLAVTASDPRHNSGRRALHHLKAVQEAVGDAIQDSVPVV